MPFNLIYKFRNVPLYLKVIKNTQSFKILKTMLNNIFKFENNCEVKYHCL